MLRECALPIGQLRRGTRGIARHLGGDRAEREPPGDDRIGFRRGLQRCAALGRVAQEREQLLAARPQGLRVRNVALPLDEGARAFGRMPGEERGLAAQPPVALRELRRGRHRDGIELVNGRRTVPLGEGDLRGDQRPRGRHARARLGRNGREGLLGLSDVVREHPLLRAQELVVVVIPRRLCREIGVSLSRLGVIPGHGQTLCALLRGGGLRLLGPHQAAGRQEQRERERRRERETWTWRDRCHTLHCQFTRSLSRSEKYSDKPGTGSPVRRGDTHRQPG